MLTPLYNIEASEAGSFHFTSDKGHEYQVYFLETMVSDKEGNNHTFLSMGFTRDGDHACIPYSAKYDPKIEATIISIINSAFDIHEHRVVFFSCFSDDGYARHRKIVFKRWGKGLNKSIEYYTAVIAYEQTELFSCLLFVNDNPLKYLILDAFNSLLKDLEL